MFFIIALFSCVARQPVAVVEIDYSETEFVYIPEGHTGFIVAAPFEQKVF